MTTTTTTLADTFAEAGIQESPSDAHYPFHHLPIAVRYIGHGDSALARAADRTTWSVRFANAGTAAALLVGQPARAEALAMDELLDRLYQAETNVSLTSEYDNGWTACWLGGFGNDEVTVAASAGDATTAVRLLALAVVAASRENAAEVAEILFA